MGVWLQYWTCPEGLMPSHWWSLGFAPDRSLLYYYIGLFIIKRKCGIVTTALQRSDISSVSEHYITKMIMQCTGICIQFMVSGVCLLRRRRPSCTVRAPGAASLLWSSSSRTQMPIGGPEKFSRQSDFPKSVKSLFYLFMSIRYNIEVRSSAHEICSTVVIIFH